MRRIHEHLDHVIATGEAELLESELQRQRAGAAESGADDLQ
jgi:hypothetical protein